jgi:hypothetical protein
VRRRVATTIPWRRPVEAEWPAVCAEERPAGATSADPMPDDRRVLEGTTRLVVDGTNVLYALTRSPSPLPAAALIGRLRAIVPPGVAVVLVLDGSPEHGMVSRRVASGVEVRYSGRFTADEVILRLTERDFAADSAGLLVVTDDFELAASVRRVGGRTVRNGWLIDRLGRQRLAAPSVGRPMAPTVTGPAASVARPRSGRAPSIAGSRPSRPQPTAGDVAGSGSAESDADGPRWSPGRGATRKHGNGYRRPGTGR